MKLYKVTCTVPTTAEQAPLNSRWLPSATEASKTVTALVKERGIKRTHFEIAEVEVPTAKKPLLEWLNKNAA